MVSEGKSQSYTQDNLHLNVKLLPTLIKKLFTKIIMRTLIAIILNTYILLF